MKGLIFTYLMTYGGSVVALFNPFVGLLIYVCFSIIRPSALWFWAVPSGSYSRIIAIALFLGWVANGFGRWKFGRGRAVLICFIGFWIWTIVATLLSDDSTVGWLYVENTFKILLPFLIGLTIINSWTQIKQLLWVMTGSVGYLALEMNIHYFSGWNRAAWNGFGSLDNNGLAVVMVIGFGLSLVFAIGNFPWWERILGGSISLLSLHTILMSYSRGGMLSAFVVAVFAFFMIPKKTQHYLIFALIFVIGIGLAGTEVTERFMTTFNEGESRDASSQSRVDLWHDCVEVMLKNPIFGIGPANWKRVASDYGWPEAKAAHRTWLQAGAELGVVGLLFIVCFYGVCLKRMWPMAREKLERDAAFCREVSQMVIVSLAGFIFGAQFVSLINVELPYYVVLLGAVVLKLTSEQHTNGVKPHMSASNTMRQEYQKEPTVI